MCSQISKKALIENEMKSSFLKMKILNGLFMLLVDAFTNLVGYTASLQ